jgi:hypothetical protein
MQALNAGIEQRPEALRADGTASGMVAAVCSNAGVRREFSMLLSDPDDRGRLILGVLFDLDDQGRPILRP